MPGRDGRGVLEQRLRGFGVVGQDATVVERRQRHQRSAEHPALHHHRRQHAGNLAVASGCEVHGSVLERALQHTTPAPQVAARGAGMPVDKRVPLTLGYVR